ACGERHPALVPDAGPGEQLRTRAQALHHRRRGGGRQRPLARDRAAHPDRPITPGRYFRELGL
ncbi:MAG: hypothetical protein AVDCRST_MAG57-332, partial [uncultured Blastococcus sp.]